MQELDRITFDPNIMGGRACIRGMRITVSLFLNLVANGQTTAQILDDYPYLEPEDIQQALRYAAWLADIATEITAGGCVARYDLLSTKLRVVGTLHAETSAEERHIQILRRRNLFQVTMKLIDGLL